MRINKIVLSCLFILLTSLSIGQENFIKITNPNIEGESAVKRHEKEIITLRLAQEATGCDIINAGSGCSGCKVTTSSFAFDINIDKAVIKLKSAMYQGTHLEKELKTFLRPGGTPFEYYKITLTDVLVSKITDATTETSNQYQVQFSAAKYFRTYIPQEGTGQAGTPATFGWNSLTNSPWDGNKNGF